MSGGTIEESPSEVAANDDVWRGLEAAFARQRRRLDALLDDADTSSPVAQTPLDRTTALALFEDQLRSRELDAAARVLRARGEGFYTIQSAGHERNVVLGQLLQITDPCLLHYRSGALMMARARRGGSVDPLRDTLLSLCASRDDPIAQGRHKVWGSRALWVPPQTSTIASHLPRASGLAFALGRAERQGLSTGLPSDAIVCCSFGDASAHHASALAGIQAARYAHRRGNPVAILFVCEDNGIGISVETPKGWIEQSFGHLSHLQYVRAAGTLDQVHAKTSSAIERCRSERVPVFLHLECVRLFGHAGSDVETSYRDAASIEAEATRDPILLDASWLLAQRFATADELRALVVKVRGRVAELLPQAASFPHLRDRSDVMSTLAPYDEATARRDLQRRKPSHSERERAFGQALPEHARAPSRRTLAAHLSSALRDAMLTDPRIWVFGEDVGRKGGVYHLTAGLQECFGSERVFDTLLDETTILGIALGAGLIDVLPVPEIQYLAYLHNALDQLRGEACSLSFFSAGQFRNPMVVRVAGLAYQKGFGGHFHNDHSIGALRDIPGLMLVTPARGDDAARLLRAALAIARTCGRVICFLEPIALYHEKDLYAPEDGAWLFDYPAPEEALWPGDVGLYGDAGSELLIVSYANGVRMSLRAARTLAERHAIRARVLDLRWLAPLPFDAIEREARDCRAVLVADECRSTGGGIADAVLARLAERGLGARMGSVRSADCYVPLGPAAAHVLLTEDQIVARALELAGANGAHIT